MTTLRIWPGQPYPLGATWDGNGVNFALFSASADKVELCLFDHTGERETARAVLPEYSHQIWHGYLPDARPGDLYGYRVYGPYQPRQGLRFNHHKLLLDPYARQLSGRIGWHQSQYGYQLGKTDLSFDNQDSASHMPKCVVTAEEFNWAEERRPAVQWPDTVIYETHVRGYTILHPDIPAQERGKFAAMGHERTVSYLRALGISSVELLPIHACADEYFLINKGLNNYWGYNSIGFFALEPRYLSSGQICEFKTMVSRLHDAGIEVLLDVVYNHTAESNELGPTLSFRGIDNSSYYRLLPHNRRYYVNDTGCGNTFNVSHPQVLRLVMDSLRYWVTEMHVDGFRFDLATTLAREDHGFVSNSAFFTAIQQDPVLAKVKLIAEPWDIGQGGYQLGNFPAGWAEWNDRCRDVLRRFWRGDQGMLPELSRAWHGSSDLFEHAGRRPWASINYISSHDGFTLNDLVSYHERYNWDNHENNQDGSRENYSANYGVEGPTDDATIQQLRERQKRNLLMSILLAKGTPMLLAGDELGRSQNGNNNAYCQDNEISWLDWTLSDKQQDLFQFVQKLLQVRREHHLFRRSRYLHGVDRSEVTDLADIQWLNPDGNAMTEDQWHNPVNHCLAVLLAGDAGEFYSTDGQQQVDETLLLVFNAAAHSLSFALPGINQSSYWRCKISTDPELDGQEALQGSFMVAAHSASLLVLRS